MISFRRSSSIFFPTRWTRTWCTIPPPFARTRQHFSDNVVSNKFVDESYPTLHKKNKCDWRLLSLDCRIHSQRIVPLQYCAGKTTHAHRSFNSATDLRCPLARFPKKVTIDLVFLAVHHKQILLSFFSTLFFPFIDDLAFLSKEDKGDHSCSHHHHQFWGSAMGKRTPQSLPPSHLFKALTTHLYKGQGLVVAEWTALHS